MKSTFLKAIKAVALSLILTLGASGLVFANGAGTPTAVKVGLNGGGNGAGGSVKRNKRKAKHVVKRVVKHKNKTA
jgi:hypothetical protein